MEKPILCIGLACVDIIANSNGFPVEDTDQRYALLVKLISLSCSCLFRISELYYRRGGNASNSSVVLAELGLNCEFLGSLAQSVDLNFIHKDLADHGVVFNNCPVIPDVEFPTSVVVINQQNGSRTILHHPTGLPELDLESFKAIQLEKYSWIHFEVFN